MQDLIEAYLSVYDDINEVKGFGGRVDPKTGKYTGEVSSPSQKVFQQFSTDAAAFGREAGSNARSRSITHGEPKESGVVRSKRAGVDVTKQDPGLAMTPADRMKARANTLEKRGQGKRANKIRAVMNRPNMEESYDFYDLVLDHLLDEGYCESEENAISMMAAMSEEWIDSIING